jgi:hypothetical protein
MCGYGAHVLVRRSVCSVVRDRFARLVA